MANRHYEVNDGWIQSELQSAAYTALLVHAQREEPCFRSFTSWLDLLALMRAANITETRKNRILQAVFKAHSLESNPLWRNILLAIFWPGLMSLFRQKRKWDIDSDELWQNLLSVFIEVLGRIDLAKRSEHLASKIINDTVHHLHDVYRKKWAILNHEISFDRGDGEILVGAKDDIDYRGIDLRCRQEAEIRQLRQHLDAGRINETEFLLLVGTRIYGKSVADYATEVGMDYELARKRRIRAEAKLRR